MKRDFDQILDECIDRISNGESVEECLKLYPESALELEPLLRAAHELRNQEVFVPSADAKSKGRERLQQEMAGSRQKRSEPRPSLIQQLFRRPKIWAPVTAALVLAIILYGFWPASTNGPSPAYAGTLEIRVTDAPNPDISAVHVTIDNIEVQRDGKQGNDGNQGWQTIIGEKRSFELLELMDIEKVLGSKEIESGHYTQIRMDVKDVTVTIDGKSRKATLPSGKLKLIGSFDIKEGKTTALTLDFDAEKSIVITGNGKVIFKPVVKMMVVEGQ